MGWYINPTTGQSKEQYLAEHGRVVTKREFMEFTDFTRGSELPVCLVDNGMFTAAAVGYNPGEVRAFTDPDDMRPKMFFLVPRSSLGDAAGLPCDIFA